VTVRYARADIQAVTVGEGHGGCGEEHRREPDPDGRPADVFFVDCDMCELFLSRDPLWSASLDELPESPDQEKARLAFEQKGAKQLSSLRTLALARMAGITASDVPAELKAMITSGPVRVPGITVCSAGHDNVPGSRYCSTCGTPMSGPAAKGELPAGDGR
jgi:hypothetical protein